MESEVEAEEIEPTEGGWEQPLLAGLPMAVFALEAFIGFVFF